MRAGFIGGQSSLGTGFSGMDFVGPLTPKRNPEVGTLGKCFKAQDPESGTLQGWAGAAEGRAPGHSWGPDMRAGCPCEAHLAVGCANARHLLVEFIQLHLELLQLLPLRAHATMVLAAGGRLARCGWLPVPRTLPVRPPTESPLSPSNSPPQVPSFTLQSASP